MGYFTESYVKHYDGMTYRIFIYDGNQSGGIQVINITKEKLEVEKLKLEIKNLKQ